MITRHYKWTSQKGWQSTTRETSGFRPQLVIVFSSGNILKNASILAPMCEMFKSAHFIGCSTAGEISGTTVSDESISLTAIQFEKSKIKYATVPIPSPEGSYQCGAQLVKQFDPHGLKHIFLLSDGLQINGSELVRGLRDSLPAGVSVTGGLAGDGIHFRSTLVLDHSGSPVSKIISAIGVYGDRIHVGFGSFGGWDSFGKERVVTRSKNNVLYELDGEPALALYKSFLGEKAAELPASGLLFPLSMRLSQDEEPVVRTILSVNEKEQSITFAGDLPFGAQVKLMKANIDRLIAGAVTAATNSLKNSENVNPGLAILISCIGRKLVLKQLVEEEVEAVQRIFGNDTVLTGFYSYGEISPFSNEARCELHNQTMTVTTFTEFL